MLFSQVLEVLDNLRVRKEQEPIACILVALPTQLISNRCFYLFNLTLIVLFFVFFDSTAPAAHTLCDSLLPPDCTRLTILDLDVGKFIDKLLQLDALLVQVVVIADDSGTHKDRLARDWIRRVQLDHVRGDASLKGLDTLVDRQITDFDSVACHIKIIELFHWVNSLLPVVVLLAETVDHRKCKRWNDNYGTNVSKDHFVGRSRDVEDRCCIHFAHTIDQIVVV